MTRGLPLVWKLMLPYLLLVIAVGAGGGVVVVHSLATRAQTQVDEQAARDLLDARSALRDRELYLLESADYAANIQGIASAVARRDDRAAGALLSSVLALKGDLSLLVATDARGTGISELDRADGQTTVGSGSRWGADPVVRRVLRQGRPAAGVVSLSAGPVLVLAAPVCQVGSSCHPTGVALAGVPLRAALRDAVPSSAALAWFDPNGGAVAATGRTPGTPPSAVERQVVRVRSGGAETVYGPLQMQGAHVADLALTVPTASAFSSVRNTALRLTAVLVLAMIGVVAIGALLARSILRQVRLLVATNRRLGGGDLSARVEVRSSDEIGELSRGFNQMAQQLQAAVTMLESRAEQSAEEVQRLLQQRTDFFAGLSHEFRTPLAVIRAQAGLLLERSGRRRSDEQVSLEVMMEAASQALELVNDVLELSRNDSLHVSVSVAPVSLPEIVARLQPTMSGLAAGADVQLDVQLEPGLPVLSTDERRVSQVLLNLVDNAIKYTPGGGHVELRAARSGDGVALTVSDTGIGIPDEFKDALFRPFSRVPGAAPQRGQASSGLGLALSRQILDALGASISVADRPGGGTVFTVHLPLSAEATARDAVPSGREALHAG